ncbi:hypothetical protein QBC40DRAFT_253745 [Triangularia verruculosa]|uniref:Uncharacterized protein n=1 Tax=Triangularia verruculosa TaxID=2587418 RepID=A0AAN7AXA5_9PEZI|nr:hypothetical protein QBC40DRAFT_253745 [Triangularia verruculosa]
MPRQLQRFRAWFNRRRPQPNHHSVQDDQPVRSQVGQGEEDGLANDKRIQHAQATDINVVVIPALDDNLTTAIAISRGLLELSWLVQMGYDKEKKSTSTITTAITNVVNTMATVPDAAKPRRVCGYHVYATSTAIANILHVRGALPTVRLKAYQAILSTYTYFGMAVLATPARFATTLAADIAMAIADITNSAAELTGDWARTIVERITSNFSRTFPSPPAYQEPLVSILTKDELTGLARALAARTIDNDLSSAMSDSTRMLIWDLFPHRCLGHCKRNDRPVCFCTIAPASPASCKLYLLPGI